MLKNVLFCIACLTLPQGLIAVYRNYDTDFWKGIGSLCGSGIFWAFWGILEVAGRREQNIKGKSE